MKQNENWSLLIPNGGDGSRGERGTAGIYANLYNVR